MLIHHRAPNKDWTLEDVYIFFDVIAPDRALKAVDVAFFFKEGKHLSGTSTLELR